MGHRDIVVTLRDTSTCLEWVENFRTGLVSVDDDGDNSPKVECGFRSLYKTTARDEPSLSSAVVEEVKKLTEQYAGEEMSITLARHNLGAALAADEVAAHVPMAVFSFGGSRVGNRVFANRVEGRGVKVLQVVNAHDLVTRVPAKLLPTSTNGKAEDSAIHRLRKTDNNKIAKSCGAVVVNRPEELQETDVGTGAGLLEVKKFGDDFFLHLLWIAKI
ncbi:hypothetical protein Cni_G14665 [Canna indica]|uniref:Fungal lipase-type domain-containing protein n=1 Tax=Canna indica TaxID=4628 RepID=A0AAQ3KC39_9LILI|nr:hypothetical protein Cni_G14665 [Canna indica]